MHPRSGRFDGELLLAEVLYNAAPDWCAEVCFSATRGIRGRLLRGPIDLNEEAAKALNDDEKNYIRSLAGAILFENSGGYVSAFYYRTDEVLSKTWADAVEEFEGAIEARARGRRVLKVNSRCYPTEGVPEDEWPILNIVLVAGLAGDYAAYIGIGEPGWVAKYGVKLPFGEAQMHFSGLKRGRYR